MVFLQTGILKYGVEQSSGQPSPSSGRPKLFFRGIDKHQAETRKQPAYQRHKVVHLLKGFQLHEAIGWYGLGQPARNYENSVL